MYYYGIDLLKIIAMAFITLQHVVGHGGVLDSSSGSAYAVVWFMEVFGYCGVNCYAIISGFVGYRDEDKRWKLDRYISLWLQTVFFGLLISVIIFFMIPGIVKISDIGKAVMPVTFDQYWYFTAYTGLFLIMPFLDMILRSVDGKKMLIAIAVLSCYTTVATRWTDALELDGGYSFVWLSILYLVGAIIKKEELHKKCKKKYIILIMSVIVLVTWSWKVWIGGIFGHGLENLPISYISPTILVISLCFVLIFGNMKIQNKLIKSIASSTFGIYLFQDQGAFSKNILLDRFRFIADLSVWQIPFVIMVVIIIIFAAGLIIDKIWQLAYKITNIKNIVHNSLSSRLR